MSLRRDDAFSSLHPYGELFAQATTVDVILGIHVGFWFFHRWARLLFVLSLSRTGLLLFNHTSLCRRGPRRLVCFRPIGVHGNVERRDPCNVFSTTSARQVCKLALTNRWSAYEGKSGQHESVEVKAFISLGKVVLAVSSLEFDSTYFCSARQAPSGHAMFEES